MEAVQTKGSGLRSALAWFAIKEGEKAKEQLVATLPPEHRAHLSRAVLPSMWYPASLVGSMQQAMASHLGTRDRQVIDRYFREMTRHVAEDNLSTFYKALLVLMTPDRMFDILPQLWGMYYKGIEVSIARVPNAKRGTCTVRGLGKLVPFMGPIACGWLELAWSKVGGKLRATEQGWQNGFDRIDPLVFDLDWS
jgi:hypothetical protein